MSFTSQSYGVQYDTQHGQAWSSGFYQLTWWQSCTSSRGFAVHTFQGSGIDKASNSPVLNVMMGDITSMPSDVRPLTFNLVGADGTKGKKQYHCITKVDIHSNPKSVSGFRIVIRTEPLIALMDIDYKNRALVGGTVTDIFRQIIGEYSSVGIMIGDVEDSLAIPEFGVIRQINLTDLQFIKQCLAPRANNGNSVDGGGYEVFSPDGKTINFSTIDYGPNVFTPDPERFIFCDEQDQSFDVNADGGMAFTAVGFDHYRKGTSAVSRTFDSDFTPSYGTDDNLFKSKHGRFEYVPLQTQLAINAWAADRHDRLRQTSNEFSIKLHGNADGVPVPCTIDLSNMHYRGQVSQTGIVSGVTHTIRSSVLVQEVQVRRAKWSLDKS